MLSAVREELRKIRSQPVFWYMLGITTLIAIASFLYEVYARWGLLDINQFSAIESFLNNSFYSQLPFALLQFCIFFALPLSANGRYFQELTGGIHSLMYTRSSYDRYIFSKVIAYAITAIYLFFIPLMLNGILCTAAFPAISYASPKRQLAARAVFLLYSSYSVSGLYNYPLLMSAYYAMHAAFLAWVMGVASLLMSTSFRKNRLIGIFYPALILMAVGLILSFMNEVFAIPVGSPLFMLVPTSRFSAIPHVIGIYIGCTAALYVWYRILKQKQPIL